VRRAPRWSTAVALLSAHLAGSPLHAESLYVIEQLVVAVNSAPDASGERVATLKSGDRVEVLERAGEQVHVRLAGGREGWVRASYLSADEPLRVRLAQRDAEVARLGEELSLLKAQLHPNPAPQLTGAAASGVASAAGSAPAAAAVQALPAPPAGSLFSTEERAHPPWAWALATALIGFGLGFGVGALLLDRHIRRKYGGLRIY
jgi:SH3-like domain-containing protein